MTSSPCAINKMANCSEKCVHFKKGKLYESYYKYGGEDVYMCYATPPSCKLWAKR